MSSQAGQLTPMLSVMDLALNTTDESLRSGFSQFPGLVEAEVRKDSDGYSKGYGSVTFNTVEEAEAAYDALDGQKIDDKEVRVLLTKWTA
ncbi:hypothetical protein DFH08DRAFT_962865 [Mycena albidolilacea]|uniref:RRM domain-containing protein n=1 Tax=Mycena albidolilacea TaxID=1033008 RepID=A0AAD6ZW87_9AGAR|nr:hypothetical protein DFH08DRAFT_962865 [Mycena albidolilacea]